MVRVRMCYQDGVKTAYAGVVQMRHHCAGAGVPKGVPRTGVDKYVAPVRK
jgi:hypothetical protein